MRQIYPGPARPDDAGLAGLYAYPGTHGPGWWLRANMVASLDGAATLRGRSGGLSADADRHVFALLRALADVIVVGAGTARAEGYGPVRPASEGIAWSWLRAGRTAAPPIAVVTRALDLDPDGPLLAETGAARTIVITTRSAPPSRRAAAARTAEVIVAGERSVDLREALAALAGRGHRRILTEGGPHLLGQFLAAGLLDELCLTLSPLLTGPGTGRIVASAVPPAPGSGGRGLPLTLSHVLVDEEGSLLCRYRRPGA